ncbi:hypothetical protein [Mycoplasma struthionis]|uniref:Uncharacterized protein n=1 Tax=Mycoplasma struthionis TaxID=538220 RepID=A0A3G8LHC1_9MOLU|nr:hypothetical protein [Mycoplasma struthionis]AZG68635.1 hypothetical protein EGN60_01465 [Mycoplasma struthionis]TPI02290.1 hypothetical protein FJM01_01325 [Mycoplasma struthionis]
MKAKTLTKFGFWSIVGFYIFLIAVISTAVLYAQVPTFRSRISLIISIIFLSAFTIMVLVWGGLCRKKAVALKDQKLKIIFTYTLMVELLIIWLIFCVVGLLKMQMLIDLEKNQEAEKQTL